MKRIFWAIALLAVIGMLGGCAAWQNKATAGYLSATTLVTTAESTVKPSCDQSAIPLDKCGQLKTIYGQIRQGSIAAGNTLILALVTTDAVQQNNLLTQYNTIMTNVQATVASYIQLYQQLQAQNKGAPLKFAISPALLEIIINAFTAIIQNIPALVQAIGNFSLTTVNVQALTSQIQAAEASLPVWN